MALFNKTRLAQIEADHAPDPARPAVLLVDDEEANLRVMRDILAPHFRILTASCAQEALDLLARAENRLDLACIISDQRMPGITGVELLQQSLDIAPDCIRIIVSGFSDINAIIDSINKAEIYRYVIKPFDTNDFVMTIQRAVETYLMKRELHQFHCELEGKVRQRTEQLAQKNRELERANRALQEASLTDPLTGLRNRRFLLQQLDADVAIILRRHNEYSKAETADKPEPGADNPGAAHDSDLVFFMVDIDHFKQVNDAYGHAAGDLVLIQMRERLQEVFRESDYLTRWGGEEFLVVARATSRDDAPGVAERMRDAIARRPFLLEDGVLISKTCSIGFACLPFLPTQPHLLSWAQVVDVADHALYMAKHAGRNTWSGLYCDAQAEPQGLFSRIIGNLPLALEQGVLHKLSAQDSCLPLPTP